MNKLKIKEYLDGVIEQTKLITYLFQKEYIDAKEADKMCPEYANNKKQEPFVLEYQLWYTKASLIVKDFLLERYDEFKKMYLPGENRTAVTRLNYAIKDFLNEYYITSKDQCILLAFNNLKAQIAILVGAKEIITSNISDLKSLLQFELFDNEIDAAENLLKNGYLRPSGAICGIVLERHLKNLCNSKNIAITKANPCINDLTDLLYKNSAIDVTNKKLLVYLSDIRNKCDHDKGVEPKNEEITDLINGTKRIISIS